MKIDRINPIDDGWWAFLTLSADQTHNISANDHVQFDVMQKSGTFDTYDDDAMTKNDWSIEGAADTDNQDLGIIELQTGKTYKLATSLYMAGSNTGAIVYQFYDKTNSTNLGIDSYKAAYASTSNAIGQGIAFAVVTPSVAMKVEVRLTSSTNRTSISGSRTWCMIQQIRDEDI